MKHYVLDFIPPVVGIEREFNTIRLGMAWAKKLQPGDHVYLMDNKERRIIGLAEVTALDVDTLVNICQKHGHLNHTQISPSEKPECSLDAGERMMNVILKIYGPHIALPTKKTTAISLKRLC